ncbi:baseplate J/gp47 family protein [Brevibacillus laterosporus]|uniref:baseplate J/gp47 family protein n=1 Tax=Brevibacillus laterosporus TaxID=1465 RepID=UPI001EF2D42C|nr:baseplate J/gp47 family protein [Brevibacillus laterosporus]MCG7318001.1 baseplate J/gp47 family protein [Brevibacillus laterosporus]
MLDEKGFKRKRFADLFDSLETKAKAVFGEQVNTTERSPLGIILRLFAWSLSLIWQLAEHVYNSAFVDTAEGVSLERVGKYIGIKKRSSLPAKGEVVLRGEPGTVVPSGFLVGTEADTIFETKQALTFDETRTGKVEVVAIEPGTKGNVPAHTIVKIVNPIAGVSEVINPESTSEGRDAETDVEFRKRYDDSVSKIGASTLDAIQAALLDTPGVRSVLVEHNDTMAYINDRPPKSVEAFVYGGEDEAIANVILNTKSGGIQAYGTTVREAKDIGGNIHNIGYTRVKDSPIYIKVALQTTVKFPIDGKEKVRMQIIRYIGGQDEDATEFLGLGIGEEVIYSKVIHYIHNVQGIEDVQLELSQDGINYSKENIKIIRAVAKTDWKKVVVT